MTVRFMRKRGERGLYVMGADSKWHVALELKLTGEFSSQRDIVNYRKDESVVVCVKTLHAQSKVLPTDEVNVYIENGLLKMKTRTSSAVVNYHDAEDDVVDDGDKLTAEEIKDLIVAGEKPERPITGPVSAVIIHEKLRVMYEVVVDRREIASLVSACKERPLMNIRIEPRGRMYFITEGSRVEVQKRQFVVSYDEEFNGEYHAASLRLILNWSQESEMRMFIYHPIFDDERVVPSMVGIKYKDRGGTCEIMALMSAGAAEGRPPTISQRREVKRRLEDERKTLRIQQGIDRDTKRAKMIEDVRREELKDDVE